MRRRAVFLDRDGVLNQAVVRDGKPYPPASKAEVVILPGVAEALRMLRSKGYVLIVVSNQPDVARGTTRRETVEAVNSLLGEKLPIDRFIMCYEDGDDSECRKPRPGMIFAGAAEFDVDLAASFMIGDRWRDMAAGVAAGCRTIFIDYNYAEVRPVFCDFEVRTFKEAANIVLQEWKA